MWLIIFSVIGGIILFLFLVFLLWTKDKFISSDELEKENLKRVKRPE